jgi:outer membrane protein assembly factor BamB
VLVGSCKGFFYSLDRHTGEVLWQYDISQDGEQSNFHGDPLVLDDVVYIGTDGVGIGHLYAFDFATGAVWWLYPDSRGVATDIASLGDAVFGTTLSDELLCLDRDTGDRLWSYHGDHTTSEDFFNGTPALTPDAIYFGGIDGTLRALDPDSGELRWAQPLGNRITTSVLYLDGQLFVGTEGGTMFRIDAVTGGITNTLDLDGMPSQAIVSADDHLCVFVDWAQSGGEIVAIDTSLAALAWRQPNDEDDKWTSARPYRVGGDVVVGSQKGRVQAFRISDGRPSWLVSIEGTARGMGFANDAVYVGTLDGKVYCVDRVAHTR